MLRRVTAMGPKHKMPVKKTLMKKKLKKKTNLTQVPKDKLLEVANDEVIVGIDTLEDRGKVVSAKLSKQSKLERELKPEDKTAKVTDDRKKKRKRKPKKQSQDNTEPSEAEASKAMDDKVVSEKKKKRGKKRGKKRKKESQNKQTVLKEDPQPDKDVAKKNLHLDMSVWSSLLVPETIIDGLRDQGFSEPTAIQRQVLPAALGGKMDILGAAETGSGKTLAFGIPILAGILHDKEMEDKQKVAPDEMEIDEAASSSTDSDDEVTKELLSDSDFSDMSDTEAESGCVKVVNDVVFDFDEAEDQDMYMPPIEILRTTETGAISPAVDERRIRGSEKLRALVLTPTRELALQVRDHMERAAKYTGIKIVAIVGGMAVPKQRRLLSYGPEIVVGTPGRIWDLIDEGEPHLSTVKHIRYLAVDETDRMLEKGHFEELHKLLDLINVEKASSNRQTFVFSATLSLVHELPKHAKAKKSKKKLTADDTEVMQLLKIKEHKRKIVDLSRKEVMAESLTETRIHCDHNEKDFFLYYITQKHPGRTLVFCNSIDCVRRLVNLFEPLRVNVLGLHADMHQKQRLKNLDRFTASKKSILIATDVAARGLDIPNIEHVVHYQVPKTSESYVHRSGRTARAAMSGISVMFIEAQEVANFKKICRTLNRSSGKKDFPMFPIDHKEFPLYKRRVEVARELDKLKLDARKEEASKSWWKKAAEEADLAISSENDSEEDELTGGGQSRKVARRKQKIVAKTQELNFLLSSA